MQKKQAIRRMLRAIGVMICVIVFGTILLIFSGLHDNIGRADVALVLGNKVELDGMPSRGLRARLDRTVELYRAGWFPLIIVSGGTGWEGFDEAVVMRDYLVAHGVPSESVLVDGKGDTTYASARNTAEIVRGRKITSVFVVTQYFHVPRARLALKRFGVATVYSAHARCFEWRDIYSVPRELVGYGHYLLRRYEDVQ